MSESKDFEPPNESFEPIRESVELATDSLVTCDSVVYRIDQILDYEIAVCTAVESGRTKQLRIGELKPIIDGSFTATPQDIDAISDEQWKIAQKRFAIIKPFVGGQINPKSQIKEHAEKHNVNLATLYRWIKKYQTRGVVTDLIPKKRGWSEGQSRLKPSVDHVIDEVIENVYLTPQRPTAQKAIQEVNRLCHQKGLEPPSAITVRSRITNIPEKLRLRKRGFKELATNRFKPVPGTFPNADYPLAVIQIDHTPADIILVDDIHRKPIGRPWITLAMDICTRNVTGYYLSFDPPSETSVGLCVAHSVLPKDAWLAVNNIEAEWPVWGYPDTIHVDNGADFRSDNFEKSCMQYGINLEFRPVKAARYGGHIERILGTFLKEIHDLPGTTFSSVNEKAEYDAEKNASLTLAEFELWFANQVLNIYHQKLHSALGMTPSKMWDIRVFGNQEITGTGLPSRPADALSVQLDFLPSFERTVQPVGVTIDDRTYYAEALRPWIGARDKRTRAKRKFVFRRDPRDISSLWFFDPDIKQYFKIPFADQRLPSISLWEYRQIREKLKREGQSSVNEAGLLHAITEQRSHIEQSKERTKKARRQAQRRREHEKRAPQVKADKPQTQQPISNEVSPTAPLLDTVVSDFGAVS